MIDWTDRIAKFRLLTMRRFWVPIIVLATSASVWGVAYSMGTIPSGDGTIQGCYATHLNDKEVQGQLRVVSDVDNCRNNETPLSWSQSGAGSGEGSILVGGFPNFAIPPVSTSTPPSATSTPRVVTTTVIVNGADTDLEVVVPDSSLPAVTSDLTHFVDVSRGDLITIRATVSGGDLPSRSLFTIAGQVCAAEDICTMAAPRDGTLKNLVVNSTSAFGSSFHTPSLQFK